MVQDKQIVMAEYRIVCSIEWCYWRDRRRGW